MLKQYFFTIGLALLGFMIHLGSGQDVAYGDCYGACFEDIRGVALKVNDPKINKSKLYDCLAIKQASDISNCLAAQNLPAGSPIAKAAGDYQNCWNQCAGLKSKRSYLGSCWIGTCGDKNGKYCCDVCFNRKNVNLGTSCLNTNLDQALRTCKDIANQDGKLTCVK